MNIAKNYEQNEWSSKCTEKWSHRKNIWKQNSSKIYGRSTKWNESARKCCINGMNPHSCSDLTFSLSFSSLSLFISSVSITGTSLITGAISAAFLVASLSCTSISFVSLYCCCTSCRAACNFAFSCDLASSRSAYSKQGCIKYNIWPQNDSTNLHILLTR